MEKYILLFLIFVFQQGIVSGQSQTYDLKTIHFGKANENIDTAAVNPAPDKNDKNSSCIKYVRNSAKKFDNVKISIDGKLTDVSPYATYTGVPPKIKMMIYTSAPPGTLVEILLGSKGRNTEYPAGTNSQYQAHTTVKNAWEELEFKFAQIPEGSETSAKDVDQITLLFCPNSANADTYYFDKIMGPSVISTTSSTQK